MTNIWTIKSSLQVCMYSTYYTYLPHSGKFFGDKIFIDGSKNENLWIKFSQMLATVTYRTARKPNSQIKFSQMLDELQNPQKFHSAKISCYTVPSSSIHDTIQSNNVLISSLHPILNPSVTDITLVQ